MGTVNLKRLENAVKKVGLKIEAHDRKTNRFIVRGKAYYGEWFVQEDKAVCLNTCLNGQESDSMTDYFPQSYHDTIKGFVQTLVRG